MKGTYSKKPGASLARRQGQGHSRRDVRHTISDRVEFCSPGHEIKHKPANWRHHPCLQDLSDSMSEPHGGNQQPHQWETTKRSRR